ncbi:hypothetical protein [Acrocarpospora sp. B8E8]|uniref:hypothetical protein n=1 Tax=Acrocarpospora sp. B8E8 TaxID=3153572 RepID=UPI00325D481F
MVFDSTIELPDGVPFVGATNWAGGRSATRHLLELGHRRIAMIAGPDRILCCRARLDGIADPGRPERGRLRRPACRRLR